MTWRRPEWPSKGQEGGVGFIRWMPTAFLHSLFFPSFRLFFPSFRFFSSFRLFFRHSAFFSVIPAKAGIPRKYSAVRAHCRTASLPLPYKEREARAFYAGFRLSPE